ncbi:LicD family protein [bacterium]|nr:LicD family protein [bacterium]
MGLGFIKKIFSVSEYSEKRNIIYIFGFKLKFPKRRFFKLRKESPYYYYKKNNIDITTLPPAEGQTREVQLANLAMLVEFDKICKQNNIHYWLDGGTLLGAIRHKGFIPWDDDIDLGMFRDDFEKITDVLANNTVNSELYIKNFKTYKKVCHKRNPYLFLDLFPVDAYGEIMSVEEQIEETKKIKKISDEFHKNDHYIKDFSEQIVKCRELRKEILVNKLPEDVTKTQYVWGLDFNHGWNNWFTNYDVYFPFKTIEFEGREFPCMNKPENYTQRLYGNYMAYPSKISLGHSAFLEFSEEEKNVMKELIKKLG